LLLLSLYTFVFVEIFSVRWPSAAGGAASWEFAVMVFAGFSLHGMLADCAIRATGLITANPAFVKRQRFPLEVLGLSTVLAALSQYAVALLLLIVFSLFVYGMPPASVLLIPVFIA